MKKQLRRLSRRLADCSGQELVEFTLVLTLISLVALVTLRGMGLGVNTKLDSINSTLP